MLEHQCLQFAGIGVALLKPLVLDVSSPQARLHPLQVGRKVDAHTPPLLHRLPGHDHPAHADVVGHLAFMQRFFAGIEPKLGQLHGGPAGFAIQAQRTGIGFNHIELRGQIRQVIPDGLAGIFGGLDAGFQLPDFCATLVLKLVGLLFKLLQKAHDLASSGKKCIAFK